MTLHRLFGVLLIVLAGYAPAHGNLIRVFSASGNFADGTVMSGTISIDVTAGTVTGDNLVLTQGGWPVGPLTATNGLNLLSLSGFPVVILGQTDDTQAVDPGMLHSPRSFALQLPVLSLVNYSGGLISPGGNLATTGPFSFIQRSEGNLQISDGVVLTSGHLTVVPEPATVVLLAGGLIAGLTMWRRRATRI